MIDIWEAWQQNMSLQGPPGTGKTRTLLVLLEIFSKLSRVKAQGGAVIGPIFAGADTNAATDNIVEGLLGRGVKVVRLGQITSVCTSKSSHRQEWNKEVLSNSRILALDPSPDTRHT